MQRTSYRARFLIAAMLALAWVAGAHAARAIRVVPGVSGRIRLEYTPSPPTFASREIDGQRCTVVLGRGGGRLKKRGYPELPFRQGRVALPGWTGAKLVVRRVDYRWVPVPPPQPSAGFVSRTGPRSPPRFGPFYSGGGIFPRQPAVLGRIRRVHGVSMATVTFFPCQYDARRQAMRVSSRIVVEVFPTGAGRVGVHRRGRRRSRLFDRMLRGEVLNPQVLAVDSTATGGERGADRGLTESGVMLVIGPQAYVAALDDFVLWKRQRGLPVQVALYPDDTGSGTSAVQDFIQTKYDSENLDFVILVGDAGDVPCNTSATNIPSDTLYTRLDGDDFYHDVLISRISANSADDVANQAAKFVRYEKDPLASGDGAWLARATAIASNQGGSSSAFGKDDFEILGEERQKWLNYGYTAVDELFDPGVTASQISDALNAGRGLVYYLGHGSDTAWNTGNFDVPHAEALTNLDTLPFVVVGACHIGDFTLTTGDCLAEAFMKAGSVTASTGAVGIVGATTAMDWDPPIVMLEAFSAYLTGQAEFTPGEADDQTPIAVDPTVTTAGALTFLSIQRAMDWCDPTGNDAAGAAAAQKIMEQTHLFGDSSLGLRTRVPGVLTVTHPAAVVPGADFIVSVTSARGALAGVTVCLYRAPDVQTTAVTDASGVATLVATPDPGDPLTLTVYHPEYIPYQTQVAVGGGELRIYSAATWPDALVGEAYSFTVRVTGGTPPYAWSVATSGTAPGWLALDAATGEASGIPDVPGEFAFAIQVTDSAGRAAVQQDVTLKVGRPVHLPASGALPDGTVLEAYDQTIAVEGDFSPFVFSLVAGALPPGLALSDSGAVRGRPEIAGTYTFTVDVTDARQRTDQGEFRLTVLPSETVIITTDSLAPADLGRAYQQAFEAQGGTGKGFEWDLAAGALPSGLALDRSGILSGVPDAGGTFGFTIRAQDDAVPPHQVLKDFKLTVNVPVHFTGTMLPEAYLGIPYIAGLPIEGTYTPFSYAEYGASRFEQIEEPESFSAGGVKQPWLDDETEWGLSLGFDFPFYDRTYSSVRVGDNGYLILGDNPGPATKWDASGANLQDLVMIAPFWNDLVIGPQYADTGIFLTQTADSATIRWRGREFDHTGDAKWALNFAVTLCSDGTIRFQYGEIRTTNRVAVGVSNGVGTDARVIFEQEKSFPNSPPGGEDLWSNHADIVLVRMRPPPAWLTLAPDGTLSGTPSVEGPHQFTVVARDTAGNAAWALLTLTVSGENGFTLDPVAGWNCLSVPVVPIDPSPAAVFPGAAGPVWEWREDAGQFAPASTIVPGRGYWVLFRTDPAPFFVSGPPPAQTAVAAGPGWALLGAIGNRSVPQRGTVTQPVWTWRDGRYRVAHSLERGLGYWFYLTSRDTLDLGAE
ncbi:MAG: hypothetical protein GXP31_02170 [Kiritimatiellaeota bacterium]|nr:hypothetical protein [Kiritimatiellota bacterium]